MRRIVIVMLSTITAVTLLFSYHTSTGSGTVESSAVVRPRATERPTTGATAGPTANATARPTAKPTGATFTGVVADTQWGPVQVRITVQGGKITASEAVQHPEGSRRDRAINGYALPILDKGVVQAQSASIDTVSGATVTSDGYLQSLQSAIDQAHL